MEEADPHSLTPILLHLRCLAQCDGIQGEDFKFGAALLALQELSFDGVVRNGDLRLANRTF